VNISDSGDQSKYEKYDPSKSLKKMSNGFVADVVRSNCIIVIQIIDQLRQEGYNENEILKMIGKIRTFKEVNNLSPKMQRLVKRHRNLWFPV
jgi:DNA polymerase III delta subunit